MTTEVSSKRGGSNNRIPSKEEQERLRRIIQEALHSKGSNPKLEAYVDNSFAYIKQSVDQLKKCQGHDRSKHGVADDLVKNFQKWAEERGRKIESRSSRRKVATK